MEKLGLPVRYQWYASKAQLKTQEYLSRNERGQSPVLETDQGFVRESQVILRYLSNLDTKQNLAGRTLFERAQVDDWMSSIGFHGSGLTGAMGNRAFTDKERSDFYGTFPKRLLHVEQQLKSTAYLCGDHMTVADILLACMLQWSPRCPVLPESVMKRMPNITKFL